MLAQLRQIAAMAEFSFATIASRIGVTLVATLGIASVSLVLVSVLATGAGFKRAYRSGGSADLLLILKASASSELGSNLNASELGALREAISAALGTEQLISSESYFVTQARLKSRDVEVNVPVRGLSEAGRQLRAGFKLNAGRLNEPGLRELIVGSRAAREYAHLKINDTVQLGSSSWVVVGEFTCDNEVANSEIWGDADLLQRTYSRAGSVQSLYLQLPTPESRIAIELSISKDKRLQVQTRTEAEYYAGLSETQSVIISVIGYVVAVGMGCVAIFVLIGSMHSSVQARSRQIGLLRALGFAATPIFISIMIETVLIAVLGGIAGAALSYSLFNGIGLSTLNMSGGFTQVPFSIWVNAKCIANGAIFSALLGLFAGLVPAWGASRRQMMLGFGS